MGKGITVIGSSNVDFIMAVERLPRVKETVSDGKFMQTWGGKGANQAVAAARAGGKVAFVTCLGDDLYAPRIVENLKADGIDTTRVIVEPGVSTGTALIMFDKRGENYLTVAPGSNDLVTVERIPACRGLISSSALVMLQMEIPGASSAGILAIAKEAGVPVMFNYAPIRACEVPVGPAMTYLVVNEVEAAALSGLPVADETQARAAAAALLAKGPRTVVLTLGSAGALVATKDETVSVPGLKVEPVDTTAAGDTFSGALAVAIVEGRPLREAARFANAAAALSVTRVGAQPSIPRRAEIDSFLRDRS